MSNISSEWFKAETVSVEVGGTHHHHRDRPARQAERRCRGGDATATRWCSSTVNTAKPREGIDFFPLTVDFVEKTSAAGKIPGGFFKREARLSDREILICRFIDRSIRPLFPDGYRDEMQITATVLAADGENPPDMCGLRRRFGGARALADSVPRPDRRGARSRKVDGQIVLNPTYEQQKSSVTRPRRRRHRARRW